MSDSLKQKTVNGVVWSALERFSTMGIQTICTLIIARFLSPSDFGTVGMLTIFTAVAQCLVDSGFRAALIRKEETKEIDYSSVFYFNIAFSLVLYGLLYLASHSIAEFYSTPILEKISKVTFLVIPITALGFMQGTICTKKLDFRTIAKVTILSAILSGIIGVVLAYKYKNVWAIVVQNLLFYSFQSLFFWCFNNWRPKLIFSLSSIKSLLPFSLNLMLSGLIGTIFNNLYGLVIGKIYTSTDLGNYSQAQKLQSLPSTSITEMIQRVTYPVLSKFQDNDDLLIDAYKRIIGVSFMVVSFIMFWLMGISTSLFDILFDERWKVAGDYFAILCLNGVFYPLHSINLNILTVKGKGKTYLNLEISRRIVFVIFLFIASFYQINIFVWSMVLYSVAVLFINMYVCGKCINYSVFSQIKDLYPTFFTGLIAMAIIKYIPSFFILNSIILLLIQTVVGIAIMVSLSVLVRNVSLYEIINIIRPYLFKIHK